MRRIALGLVSLALVVGGLTLPAFAGGYDHGTTTTTSTTVYDKCKHKPWKPECQETTTTTQATTTSTEATTTTTEATTTTTEATTTSTQGTTTSTVVTTTLPLTALWTGDSVCDVITAEFGEGIVQVDIYNRTEFGDLGPADGLTSITVSGQEVPTGMAGEWILVPVVVNGYTPEPDQITVFTERCETTSTSISPSSSDPTGSTLPFTDNEELGLMGAGATVMMSAGLMILLLVAFARRLSER